MRALIGFSIVALALTRLMLFVFEGKLTGLRGLSLWLCSMAVVLPVLAVYLMYRARRFELNRMWLVGLVIVLTMLINPATTKFTSVGYSFLFILFFVLIMNSLQFITREAILKLTKIIIVLYFINILIAQLLVTFGIESGFLSRIFQSLYDPRIDRVRYYGFGDEPSSASFIVVITYYVYLKMVKLCNERPSLVISLLAIYEILFIKSIYGYFLLLAVGFAVYYRTLKRSLVFLLPALFIVLVLAINIEIIEETGRFGRVAASLVRGDFFNPTNLKVVDHSAFHRLGIFLEYGESVNLGDPKFYFGHGAQSHLSYFSSHYITEIRPDASTGQLNLLETGLLPGFLYDYGLIGFGLVVMVILGMAIPRLWSLETLFLVMLFFNANFNTQLFWYVILILSIGGYFYRDNMTSKETQHEPALENVGP